MNAVQCHSCKAVIRSWSRHHFVTCSCGNVSVDGGEEYNRRLFRDDAAWTELNTLEEWSAAYWAEEERKATEKKNAARLERNRKARERYAKNKSTNVLEDK